jgi:arylformamidase|tara:strand:- start:1390 stop:2241 length:852 start_codon:yes stop_codon:yes gene_type:complete
LYNWKKLSLKEKELSLNPKNAVLEHPKLQAMATSSAKKYRNAHSNKYINVSYGKRTNQKLDIFLPENINNNPVQLYFHGGYWIARDKFDHSHLAEPAVINNIIHVSVNYDLSPNVTLDIIVEETYECLEWVIKNICKYGGNPYKINLVGHSAGAHLVAMALTKNYSLNSFIKSATLISGIYQPQITKYLSINKQIHIDKNIIKLTDVYKNKIVQKTNILIVVGSDEPKPWKKLSIDFSEWLQKNKISFKFYNAIHLNHFTLVKALSNYKSPLSKKVINMSVEA